MLPMPVVLTATLIAFAGVPSLLLLVGSLSWSSVAVVDAWRLPSVALPKLLRGSRRGGDRNWADRWEIVNLLAPRPRPDASAEGEEKEEGGQSKASPVTNCGRGGGISGTMSSIAPTGSWVIDAILAACPHAPNAGADHLQGKVHQGVGLSAATTATANAMSTLERTGDEVEGIGTIGTASTSFCSCNSEDDDVLVASAEPLGVANGAVGANLGDDWVAVNGRSDSTILVGSRSLAKGSFCYKCGPVTQGLRQQTAGKDDAAAAPGPTKRGVLHLIILSHGHRGQATDLSYLRESIVRNISSRQTQSGRGTGASDLACASDGNSSCSHREAEGEGATSRFEQDESFFVVHSATCNEFKTDDGVERGGERLVEEIREVVRTEVGRIEHCGGDGDGADGGRVRIEDISLTVVGNSLGGLYVRYAVARLCELAYDTCDDDEDGQDDGLIGTIDGRRVTFNVFCTTASPHLGVASHTYVKVPRVAESMIAKTMGETGRDLFRINNLLKEMATSDKYLRPLSAFRKRIAYANAFQTDFPVPASTAAFLDPKSPYPHKFVDHNHSGRYPHGMVVAEVHTENKRQPQPQPQPQMEQPEPSLSIKRTGSSFFSPLGVDDDCEDADELVEMSHALNALGWKKVFVDMRDSMPVSAPLPLRADPKAALDRLVRDEAVVESRHLAEAVSASDRVSVPVGHNMIVAWSRGNKSTLSTRIHKRGRPVMDTLAEELVEEVLSWNDGRR